MSTDISSTVSLIPGQVMMSGSTTVDVSMPRLCRAVSTPRLNGFIVNWCRFSKSNPLLGSFHHLNHSSILTRGSNKFFEENIVTPMQYQEVKKLRHNPYVGGGYIRSHANLFRDLQYGYWAKERMAAREERKKALVRETKRPRLTPAQSVSSVSSEDSTASSLDWSLASPSLSLSPASIDSSASDLTEEGRVAKSFSYDSIESKSPRTRRNSRVIPASLLDANHGTSRKFEDFYSLEKGAALGIRHMPKLSLVNNSPASKQSQNNAPSSETKISYSARQLGTSATSGSMVGRGAYSSVRVGTHLQSGDRFAIKQIAKRFLYSEDEREAIRREVRIHSQSWLAHQNIVFLYDYFEDEHFFYLVMDHCEGGDLETYMRKHKRKGVTEWQAQMLFMQLMKALTFLHDKNIIHGDIKPQNVLLSKKPFSIVKICDFGNARYAKDVRYFSKTGSVSKVPYTCITGTHGYIAPEILNKQNYGPEIDVWAAGIMCFTMLGGYQPFHPASACLTAAGPNFNDPVWSTYSEECRDFISKLLQRDPAKRISAAEARTHPWIVGA